MKQTKSTTGEKPVEKQNNKQVQNPVNPDQKNEPSWAVYYLFGAFGVGIILILLKVLGIL